MYNNGAMWVHFSVWNIDAKTKKQHIIYGSDDNIIYNTNTYNVQVHNGSEKWTNSILPNVCQHTVEYCEIILVMCVYVIVQISVGKLRIHNISKCVQKRTHTHISDVL